MSVVINKRKSMYIISSFVSFGSLLQMMLIVEKKGGLLLENQRKKLLLVLQTLVLT